MKLTHFEEHAFFMTVRISTSKVDGSGSSIGTGFLMNVDTGDGKSIVLLISNRHVLQDPSDYLILNFNRKIDDTPKLGELYTLKFSGYENAFIPHPDPETDLACINISSSYDAMHQDIYIKWLTYKMFSDYSEAQLHPGKDVWFVGYPENRFDSKNNLPLMRRGYISSVPTVDFEGRKQIVIDAQVFPGSSGSPVFAIFGRHFKFMGVVTATMIRHGQLRTLPTVDTRVVSQQMMGLGIVLKSELVRELCEHVLEIYHSANGHKATSDVI